MSGGPTAGGSATISSSALLSLRWAWNKRKNQEYWSCLHWKCWYLKNDRLFTLIFIFYISCKILFILTKVFWHPFKWCAQGECLTLSTLVPRHDSKTWKMGKNNFFFLLRLNYLTLFCPQGNECLGWDEATILRHGELKGAQYFVC